jgi:hypothetical protein
MISLRFDEQLSMAKRSNSRRVKTPAPRSGIGSAGGAAAVVLRTPQRDIPLQTDAINLAQEAMRWTYVVRSRQRWASTETAVTQQGQAAADLLKRMGVDAIALAELAHAGMVEVSMRWRGSEETDWQARILPWEYVVAGATSSLRGRERPLTVMRRLDRGDKAAPAKPMNRVLFVASEPGPLRGAYQFDAQRDLVRTYLQTKPSDWQELDSPTAAELSNTIAAFKPDIVHLAGFDSHQAQAMVRQSSKRAADRTDGAPKGTEPADERLDGYILAKQQGLHYAGSEELGRILTSAAHRPRLVALNIRNSGARIAPLVVAHAPGPQSASRTTLTMT